MPDVLLLLALLLFAGLGTLSDKKVFNAIGIISLFTISFALIKMGIENDYFVLAETKVAIAILLYYLIVFIISKNKRLIIMCAIIIGILAILFVPQKRYVNDLHWFPNNFYSLEYYKPIETPDINVSVNNQQILCNKGSFQWSKTVDGQNIMAIGDSFINPVYKTYKQSLIITDDNLVNIDTSYNISNVKYTEYKEEYAKSDIGSENPVFSQLDFNSEDKTIDLKYFENGIYVITFTIRNDKDYADYSFKVEVQK